MTADMVHLAGEAVTRLARVIAEHTWVLSAYVLVCAVWSAGRVMRRYF